MQWKVHKYTLGEGSASRRDETAPRAACHRDDFSQDAVASPPLAASNSGAACGSEPCSAARPQLGADAAEQRFVALCNTQGTQGDPVSPAQAFGGRPQRWLDARWAGSSACSPSSGCPQPPAMEKGGKSASSISPA